MLRMTLFLLLLAVGTAAGIAAVLRWSARSPAELPVARVEPAAPQLFGGHRTPFAAYRTWSLGEQSDRVNWVMQGVWAAHQVTGKDWHPWDSSLVTECPADRHAIMKVFWDDYWVADSLHQEPFRGYVWSVWKKVCRHSSPPPFPPTPADTYGAYKGWPPERRRLYVDGVMEGIEEAFEMTKRYWSGKSLRLLEGCKVAQPAVRAMLEKSATPVDDERPVALLVFIALEDACREANW